MEGRQESPGRMPQPRVAEPRHPNRAHLGAQGITGLRNPARLAGLRNPRAFGPEELRSWQIAVPRARLAKQAAVVVAAGRPTSACRRAGAWTFLPHNDRNVVVPSSRGCLRAWERLALGLAPAPHQRQAAKADTQKARRGLGDGFQSQPGGGESGGVASKKFDRAGVDRIDRPAEDEACAFRRGEQTERCGIEGNIDPMTNAGIGFAQVLGSQCGARHQPVPIQTACRVNRESPARIRTGIRTIVPNGQGRAGDVHGAGNVKSLPCAESNPVLITTHTGICKHRRGQVVAPP